MQEPSLSCGQVGTTYRFTWLRSFHHPVAVRITDNGDHAVLRAIELDGGGGFHPGKEFRRIERALSPVELERIRRAFAQAPFGSMPTTDERMGADGAEWIVEAVDDGLYHLVVRWSPDSGDLHDIGLLFLELTGWSFEDVY